MPVCYVVYVLTGIIVGISRCGSVLRLGTVGNLGWLRSASMYENVFQRNSNEVDQNVMERSEGVPVPLQRCLLLCTDVPTSIHGVSTLHNSHRLGKGRCWLGTSKRAPLFTPHASLNPAKSMMLGTVVVDYIHGR